MILLIRHTRTIQIFYCTFPLPSWITKEDCPRPLRAIMIPKRSLVQWITGSIPSNRSSQQFSLHYLLSPLLYVTFGAVDDKHDSGRSGVDFTKPYNAYYLVNPS